MNQQQRDQAMFDLIKEMLKQQSLRDMEAENPDPEKRSFFKKVLKKLKHYFKKPKKESYQITNDKGFKSRDINY